MMSKVIPPSSNDLFAYSNRVNSLPELPIERLHRIVDWEAFRPTIEQAFQREAKGPGGRPHFDRVFMFKVLVLQRFHGLSDEQTELQLLDRLTFQRFLGITINDQVPDKNTIWTYRERLISAGAFHALFEQFTASLSDLNLEMREGVILDSTFVDVRKRHCSQESHALVKDGHVPTECMDDPHRASQTDCEAVFAKKGDETHFGYKNHAAVDMTTGLIVGSLVTVASAGDGPIGRELIRRWGYGAIFGDCAYHSKATASLIDELSFEDRTCVGGQGKKTITDAQRAENTTKSRTRSRVEHVFGQMAQMGMDFQRYIGLVRNEATIMLSNLVYNLRRMEFLKRSGALA